MRDAGSSEKVGGKSCFFRTVLNGCRRRRAWHVQYKPLEDGRQLHTLVFNQPRQLIPPLPVIRLHQLTDDKGGNRPYGMPAMQSARRPAMVNAIAAMMALINRNFSKVLKQKHGARFRTR